MDWKRKHGASKARGIAFFSFVGAVIWFLGSAILHQALPSPDEVKVVLLGVLLMSLIVAWLDRGDEEVQKTRAAFDVLEVQLREVLGNQAELREALYLISIQLEPPDERRPLGPTVNGLTSHQQ